MKENPKSSGKGPEVRRRSTLDAGKVTDAFKERKGLQLDPQTRVDVEFDYLGRQPTDDSKYVNDVTLDSSVDVSVYGLKSHGAGEVYTVAAFKLDSLEKRALEEKMSKPGSHGSNLSDLSSGEENRLRKVFLDSHGGLLDQAGLKSGDVKEVTLYTDLANLDKSE